ncbi:hypothetical protein D3C83_79920 [compost metagenome]
MAGNSWLVTNIFSPPQDLTSSTLTPISRRKSSATIETTLPRALETMRSGGFFLAMSEKSLRPYFSATSRVTMRCMPTPPTR